MYNFIFWSIYSKDKKWNKGEWLSRNDAAIIVGLTLCIHIAFLFAICKAVYYQTLSYSANYFLNKNVEILIVLACIAISFFYYNKQRVEKLKEKYKGAYLSFTILNVIKFVSITLLPLLIIIGL